MRFAVDQLVGNFDLGLELAVFVDVQFLVVFIGGLDQRGVDRGVTDVHIGLPFVVRAALAGVLGLGVVDGGEVTVAALVIHGQGGCFVVGGRVGAVKCGGDDLGVSREIQAQFDQRSLLGVTGGFFRDGEAVEVTQVGLAATVDRGCHQCLPRRVDHVVLVVHGERAITGVNVLQAVGRFEREKSVAGNRQVERV